MDIIQAKTIVHHLANGIDPMTGEYLPEESVYHSPEVIRALFTVLEKVDGSERRVPATNAGQPWTEDEDERLAAAYLSGEQLTQLAKEHGRTRGAIESRLAHLGLR